MKRFLVAICAAGLLFSGCGSNKPVEKPAQKVETQSQESKTESEPVKSEPLAQVETPAPVQQAAPDKVLNLGMTFEQFKATYNAKINEIAPQTGWDISEIPLQQGDVQDVFTCVFTENDVMLGIVDKESGMVKGFIITVTPRGNHGGEAGLMSYLILIATLNPELSYQERWILIDELKLTPEKIPSLKQSPANAVRNNVKYKTEFVTYNGGMFYFTASAKDF